MLQIKNICKKYVTGDLVQDALKDVSLNFRDNEFVAILGPSGSGKTTFLNIIGGLDRYDSGDLIINHISTKKYKNRDWDSYRNHTVGFVFQSYNLIPHQSVLANVELALTISGVSRKERRERAKEALEKVGLGDHIHKKPNQMSGGQMQRVAIARALVNNPDILLADEPTGALDTDTSIQVMELLKEVAKDRLVVMVTHNPELAEEYANRVVKLKDGNIIDDSHPYHVENNDMEQAEHKNMGKSSMGFLTSLSLSFNNLGTKKGRTFLTAFAGSIGIIGISLILSLSNGVNTYIEDIQRETMTSYPVTIEAETIDLSSIMSTGGLGGKRDEKANHDKSAVYSNSHSLEMANKMVTSLAKNNLTEFKKYLDKPESDINKHLGNNGIIYSYDVPFGVFSRNKDGELIDANTNAFTTDSMPKEESGVMGEVRDSMMNSMSSVMGKNSGGAMNFSETFEQLTPGKNKDMVGTVVTDSYDIVQGAWPKSYNEVVLVLDENNEIPTTALYALGMLPSEEYDDIMKSLENGEEFKAKTYSWTYDEICKQKFYLVPACDYYVKNENGTFNYIGDDKQAMDELAKKSVELKVSGIIRPKEDADNANIKGAVGYTNALTNYIIDYSNKSEIVKAQQDSKNINVINGMNFAPKDDNVKIQDAKKYISNMGVSDKAKLWKEMATMSSQSNPKQLQALSSLGEVQLADMADKYLANPKDEVMLKIYDSYISSGTYEDNMKKLGYVSMDAPSSISIYVDTFEDKDAIAQCIEDYNKTATKDNKITYTDFVAMMTSSITTIINVISYVLIAFVAVSLVVSSIMIGIITYISVLERTKEIGILRAMGASKRNISQVFNAETMIVGMLAGILGVGLSALMLIPGNAIIHKLLGTTSVNASLPLVSAVVLVVLSIILTFIGGLIPSKKAARKDPVTALRSE